MNYLSLVFYAFIPLFIVIYYVLPQKYRYIAIFVGSYIFYGYQDAKMVMVLVVITLISYLGGLAINAKRDKWVLCTFFAMNILVLLGFKYTNFAIWNLNFIISKVFPQLQQVAQPMITLPIGLSFIVFQSCTYLTDVYRENVSVEKNIIRYGAFVAFFPTVLSGPIQKARELLPQIKTPGRFDAIQAQKGTILFVWGLFEKILVANKLAVIVNRVFDDYLNYNSAYYIVAAICFSIYIYADFSSYSDMARGIAMIMGINVGKNFNNPYMSETTSEFWNRWHISLNSWFIENVYIPLGGNRKGKVRKYINMMIVFFISGLWHGANYHYIIWGVINGAFAIFGQIISPIKKVINEKLKIDENLESIRFCNRAIVFGLITITWIFFRNGVSESLYMIRRIILFNPINFFDPKLLEISGSSVGTFITIIVVVTFCIIQNKRQNERAVFEKYSRQPLLMQCIPVAFIICICIFSICSTDAQVNTQFLYFQF